MVLEALLAQVAGTAAEARAVDVRIGTHSTVVAVELNGELRAGISATQLDDPGLHHWGGPPPVTAAGRLHQLPVPELVALLFSPSPVEVSVGMAAVNALLEVDEAACVAVNAADLLAERGAGRRVAVIGHFPFVPRLREQAAALWVLELNPREGDLPAAEAANILPQAEVIAVTGTVLLNHTFEELRTLWRPEAFVVMLGGTTPLTPLLFRYGVSAVAGTRLTDPHGALWAVSQAATFSQIPGRRTLTLIAGGHSGG